MQQDIEVVPKIQRSSNYHQKRETVTHLNPEEGYLQAAPTGGRTNPNTGTASKYHIRVSGRRGYCSCSAETTGRTGGTNIKN